MLPGGRPDPAHRTVQRVGVEQESADVAVPGVPVEREDAVAGAMTSASASSHTCPTTSCPAENGPGVKLQAGCGGAFASPRGV